MKTQAIFFSVLILTSLLLAACTKADEQIAKPALFITVKDEKGKAVIGASIRLYKSVSDTGITALSDTTGVVIFYDLEEAVYYWHAEKGCMTNWNSQRTLKKPLVPGAILYGYSVMSETSALKITTVSSFVYNVTDSVFKTRVSIDSPYIAYPKIGSYRIYNERTSSPGVIKDTLISIACGDTAVIQLP